MRPCALAELVPSRRAPDTAPLRLGDETPCVLRQQISFCDQIVRSLPDRRNIGVFFRIALFQRRTRVSGSEAFSLGRRKRNEAALQGTEAVLEEVLVEKVPAGVGADGEPRLWPSPGDEIAYCMQLFRSYDPASGTYLGYDGYRHPCPLNG